MFGEFFNNALLHNKPNDFMMLFYSAHIICFIIRGVYYLRLSSVSSPWGFPWFWVESTIRLFHTGEKPYLMGFGKLIVDVDVLLAFMMII